MQLRPFVAPSLCQVGNLRGGFRDYTSAPLGEPSLQNIVYVRQISVI